MMTKELEKYVITTPSRVLDRDGANGLCIEKIHVGESIEDKLTDYVLDKITHREDGIAMEWWVRKAYAIDGVDNDRIHNGKT